MKYVAFYGGNNKFELTESEFQQAMKAWNSGSGIFIPRLKVYLSKSVLWAGVKPIDENIGYAREDGRKMFKKFGEWKCCDAPDLQVNLEYYKSVANDDLILEGEEEEEDEKLEKPKRDVLKNEGFTKLIK